MSALIGLLCRVLIDETLSEVDAGDEIIRGINLLALRISLRGSRSTNIVALLRLLARCIPNKAEYVGSPSFMYDILIPLLNTVPKRLSLHCVLSQLGR